ncbi:MAG: 4-(cytidine 5'-diphospho)-2-C-methyl-D-erythritol kinase [Blautia sp.]|nr:4-(cytidine 5'-diphospho)-2-C-methyl-D-erythritol kinase [Blautia sp.]MCM1201454.1 4-(cytidine 5'-diphospho)-2-C-methyl-D-erythritol kinase [Bacteroides fragilis]
MGDTMERLTRKAYAKINLALDVLRRREDGYHEVKMIMQTIGLCDTLTFRRRKEPGVVLKIDRGNLSAGKENLICRAAEKLFAEAGIAGGAEIFLEKRIPIAAGMAGGSADAAAALAGLNELFGLGYSMERLQALGVTLGADIPYCLMGGTALSEGIGEVLTKLPAPPPCILLVAKPDIDVSTKFVYENLHADALPYHPDIDGMADALRNGSLYGIAERMGNVLETVTVREYPVIDEIKEFMKKAGALNALMSGSGPTVFGLFTEKGQADTAAERIRRRGLAGQVFVTGFHE